MSDDICGAECTDGTPCQNDAGSCPWHGDNTPETGRPSKLTEGRQENIAVMLEDGHSIGAAARSNGITVKTFFNWMEKGEQHDGGPYAEFFDRIKNALPWSDGEYNHSEHCSRVKSKLYSGADSWNWRGGGADYRGPNWTRQRRRTLIRDQARCRGCGINEHEHVEVYGYSLHVHHITPRREFSKQDPAQNRLENLITLCHRCHETVESPKVPQQAIISP